ncbi:hypothetical protein I350_07998 [Cryptococcus amylolentus CBS 6273]|uniref:MHD1 domain-containing protein n=1 Tax=Cryptococcus amylolentus CBS 6273 TaxID=1296118 RepID=A0A1E3J818_9TREE|nr:hypothetical protein I350_07998 [Cryptococcus amylolentus CBS 6273]
MMRHQATPPPLPRLNTRTYSSSTASTTHSALLPPPSPLGAFAAPRVSPASIGMGQRSVSNASSASDFGLTDEIDRLGYLYPLRTASDAPQSTSPPPPQPQPCCPQTLINPLKLFLSRSSPAIPSSHQDLPLRLSLFSFHSAPFYNTAPKLPDTPKAPTTPPPNLRRKRQGVKLPKEFLREFWGILGGEEGDQGWKTTVKAFLGMIKKGTKSSKFHLLQLLYNTLPRSSHFSPMSRAQTDKVKELLSRLRSEVQSYMLASSPNPAEDGAWSNLMAPVATTPKKSPSVDAFRRKPSPIWDGDLNEMINTVGQIWGVRRDVMDRDVLEIRSHEKFVEPLHKRPRRALTASPPSPLLSSPPKRADKPISPKHSQTSTTTFPCSTPPPTPANTLPQPGTSTAASSSSSPAVPSKSSVASLLGVPKRATVRKEKDLEGLVKRWGDSIGISDESPLARTIAYGLKLISSDLKAGDPLPSVMIQYLQYLHILLFLTTSNLLTIFRSSPPPAPLLLLHLLCLSCSTLRRDELVGAAIGVYSGVAKSTWAASAAGRIRDWWRGRRRWRSGWRRKSGGSRRLGDEDSRRRSTQHHPLPPTPFFLAELQALSLPSPSGQASDIFPLYETTGKLLELWEDLVEDRKHDFELDAFFEPFVRGWLKETEGSEVEGWVAWSWVPEGENKHSQSVIDLFGFIRGSASTILHDLPLSVYKRAKWPS